jgi:hypothetical protein
MQHGKQRGGVAPIERLIGPPDKLYVLVRHLPLSIAQPRTRALLLLDVATDPRTASTARWDTAQTAVHMLENAEFVILQERAWDRGLVVGGRADPHHAARR